MAATILPRILLADDHKLVRAGLRLLIEQTQKYHIVGEVGDGKALVGFLKTRACDLIVLDLGMPLMHGLDALQEIHKTWPQIKVIVVTTHRSKAFLRRALENGAQGYVLKDDARETLLFAIQTVLEGQRFISPSLLGTMIREVMPADTGKIAAEVLSPREREILHLTANGLTSRDIGERLDISHRTVEVHRANIKEKLGLATNTELVKFAIENGLD